MSLTVKCVSSDPAPINTGTNRESGILLQIGQYYKLSKSSKKIKSKKERKNKGYRFIS